VKLTPFPKFSPFWCFGSFFFSHEQRNAELLLGGAFGKVQVGIGKEVWFCCFLVWVGFSYEGCWAAAAACLGLFALGSFFVGGLGLWVKQKEAKRDEEK
jgi:hypothetical protein